MCNSHEDWRNSWREFIQAINEQLALGKRLADVELAFRNSSVTWHGVVVEKKLAQKQGLPSIFMQMDECAITDDGRDYPASSLTLRFANDAVRIAPWWHVPIGTLVEFEATIAREVWSSCISMRCDRLVVDTKINPVLKSPFEYASSVDVPDPLERAVHPEPKVECLVAPPDVAIPRTDETTLEWDRSRQGGTTLYSATLRPHAAVDVALAEFWEKVLADCPNNSDWNVIEVVGLPETGQLSLGFLTSDLSHAQQIRFAFNAGNLAEALDGVPSDKATEARAFDFLASFWTIVHAGLCNARGIVAFVKDHPNAIVLAIEHDDASYRQLQLPLH